MSQKWEKEVKAIYDKVEEMYKAYQAEAVLLPQDLKKKREDDILKKEKEAKDLQMKYFGAKVSSLQREMSLCSPFRKRFTTPCRK